MKHAPLIDCNGDTDPGFPSHADDIDGRAHWEAWYTLAKTGRKVHNVIDATFEFRDGRITLHRDSFDLWRWAGMALGVSGKLLGWTPVLQNAVRREARAGLRKWGQSNHSSFRAK